MKRFFCKQLGFYTCVTPSEDLCLLLCHEVCWQKAEEVTA